MTRINRLLTGMAVAWVLGAGGLVAADAPSFKVKPIAKAHGSNVRIDFEVDQATDVAVEILDTTGGNVVRHLVAGQLGPRAPEPLQKDSLKQSIVWDGKNDAGISVRSKSARTSTKYNVRVSLGLTPRFDRVIGWNGNRFGSVEALAVSDKGELYVLSGNRVIVLDRQGKFVRQVHPAPSGADAKKSEALTYLTLGNGTRLPQWLDRTGFYPDLRGLSATMFTTPDGLLVYGGGYKKPRRLVRLGVDGGISADAFTLKIAEKYRGGQLFLASDSARKVVYASGFIVGGYPEVPAHGIMKALLTEKEGVPVVFAGDMEKAGSDKTHFKFPRGLATDEKGNVYVADYGNNRIVVLDNAGRFVRQWPCQEPVYVEVDTKRQTVYVMCATADFHYGDPDINRSVGTVLYTSAVTIRKFGAEGKPMAHRVIEPPFIQYKKQAWRPIYSLRMALDCTAENPILWIGAASPQESWCKYTLLRLEDKGSHYGRCKYIGDTVEVADKSGLGLTEPKHLALDRKNDILYVRDGTWWRLVRINGDGSGFKVLSLRDARAKMALRGGEMDVAPDGALVVSCWHNNHNDVSLFRFDSDGQPLNFPGSSTHEIYVGQKKFHWLLRGSTARGSRGLCVAPSGDIYVMRYTGNCYNDKRARSTLDVYGPDGKPKATGIIKNLTMGAGGVRVDRTGHIYVADHMRPLGETFPDWLKALPTSSSLPAVYRTDYGALFKFAPQGGEFVRTTKAKISKATDAATGLWSPPSATQRDGVKGRWAVKGADWQVTGVSPVPVTAGKCVCEGARFDLDEFGRCFIPDRLGYAVNVVDSEGNRLTRFGSWGNATAKDSGRPAAVPEIGFAKPDFVAASARYCYVSDGSNDRVVRVRLDYAVRETVPLAP